MAISTILTIDMNTSDRRLAFLAIRRYGVIIISIALLSMITCQPNDKKSPKYIEAESFVKAKCGSCHSYVSPALLDRISWPRVLSVMKIEMEKLDMELNDEDWQKINTFYLNNSVPAFYSTSVTHPPTQSTQFLNSTAPIASPLFNGNGLSIKWNAKENEILLGQQQGQILSLKNGNVELKYSIKNIPVDFAFTNSDTYVLGMGSLGPSNNKTGQLIQLSNSKILIDSLIRPVQLSTFKLKNNKKNAFLISSFGSTIDKIGTGKLSLFEEIENSWYEHIIDPLPGASQSITNDINNDGYLDIVALYAQGNEMINIYYNNKDSSFSEKTVVTFPPVYGSNSFELVDFNRDGYLDIITTNGDNDDYSQVFKPYHGVRIFLNDKNDNFEEKFFYHVNGAAKVKCNDFDQDGDIDCVSLSMYPDLFSRPYEKLLYFDNISSGEGLAFDIQYLEDTASANWILLDIGDVDSDGDMDIITAHNNAIHGLLPPDLQTFWRNNRKAYQIFYNTHIP